MVLTKEQLEGNILHAKESVKFYAEYIKNGGCEERMYAECVNKLSSAYAEISAMRLVIEMYDDIGEVK